MKATKKYNEQEVVASLNRKRDLQVTGNTIKIYWGARAANDIGIKTKGKIDFLTKYCGYYKTYINPDEN